MPGTKFIYVTYIRTTPEKLWDALTKPEFTRLYWMGTRQESEWEVGSAWQAFSPKGEVWDAGEILEIDRPKRLVLTWRNEHFPDVRAEGFTRLTYELAPVGDSTKLTLSHESDVEESKAIASVRDGWPVILASLKTLLETGDALEQTKHWPEGL